MLQQFKVNIGSLTIHKPFTIPSGVVTTVASVIARIARDVPDIGFLTTKTISVNPRPGYREPILHEYHPGCFVNAVGLANPGAKAFLESVRPLKPLSGDKPLVVSIMGETPEEFLECVRILEPCADAFELNLSCPHVKGAGQSVGSDPVMVGAIIGLLKKETKKPIIPKLSPNLANFQEMVILCAREGADGLSLINTVGPGTATDCHGAPILSNINGGLSGSAIRPVGLKLVREAASIVDIPIIASGGISGPDDVRAYRNAGASLFGVGSALAFVNTGAIPAFFKRLASGLEPQQAPHERPARIHPSRRTDYIDLTVVANESPSSNMFQLTFDRTFPCHPGQFYFIRLPGVGEKPFSPMMQDPLSFLVRAVGPFTSALQNLQNGAPVQIRGPYGKGFPTSVGNGPLLMIGGGTGAAPILMAAKSMVGLHPKVFLGFSEALDDSSRLAADVKSIGAVVAIDEPVKPGAVITELASEISRNKSQFVNSTVFICGPAAMMQAALNVVKAITSDSNIFVAREDVMKCGIGVCGSCGTPSGLRSCVDGPVIKPDMA